MTASPRHLRNTRLTSASGLLPEGLHRLCDGRVQRVKGYLAPVAGRADPFGMRQFRACSSLGFQKSSDCVRTTADGSLLSLLVGDFDGFQGSLLVNGYFIIFGPGDIFHVVVLRP